jgi:MEMO1 family protein
LPPTTSSTDPDRVRPPIVAGSFYPATPEELVEVVDATLAGAATADEPSAARPKALIVPHAGYVYSGPVAATAYARLRPWRHEIDRVVLLGPAHRIPVRSMALSSADGWDTPLGRVPVDEAARAAVADLPGVEIDDAAHAPEHSIEVELPFLQRVLRPEGDEPRLAPFRVLPIVVGHAPADEVATVLDAVWGGDETLIVISSDLSHYEDYDTAADHDRRTAAHILAGRVGEIGPRDACGAFPVRGLLVAAGRRHLDIELVDLRSSGDTAGPANQVVGYGSFVLSSSPAPPTASAERTPDRVETEPGLARAPVEPAPGRVADDRMATEDPPAPVLGATDELVVLDIAVEAIRARFERRSPTSPGDKPGETLIAPAATFVTLRDRRRLLGCIGSLGAERALLDDVALNAISAAFHDPRLPALTPFEFERLSVQVSVLGPLEPLAITSVAELRQLMTPGVHGLAIEAGWRRGTFLPSVWEHVPRIEDFLDQLWRKTGLAPGAWPGHLRVWRYRTIELAQDGPRAPVRSVIALLDGDAADGAQGGS